MISVKIVMRIIAWRKNIHFADFVKVAKSVAGFLFLAKVGWNDAT